MIGVGVGSSGLVELILSCTFVSKLWIALRCLGVLDGLILILKAHVDLLKIGMLDRSLVCLSRLFRSCRGHVC